MTHPAAHRRTREELDRTGGTVDGLDECLRAGQRVGITYPGVSPRQLHWAQVEAVGDRSVTLTLVRMKYVGNYSTDRFRWQATERVHLPWHSVVAVTEETFLDESAFGERSVRQAIVIYVDSRVWLDEKALMEDRGVLPSDTPNGDPTSIQLEAEMKGTGGWMAT